MNDVITVNIYNWNCYKNGYQMALDVLNNELVLNLQSSATAPNWVLIPNLVLGATTGGYTVFNPALNGCAEQPVVGHQIKLGDDPTPFGAAAYCWTLWPAGESADVQLYAIQDSTRGPAMDASGSSCDANTPVLFWGWNGGDNQRWIIAPVS